MPGKRTLAKTIEVDYRRNEIRIDGIAFPYHVEQDVEPVGLENVAAVRVGILADVAYVIHPDGRRETIKPTPG